MADEETEGGRWVFRDKNVHRCNKPGYDPEVKAGDRWKCGYCNKTYEVTEIKYHHDPRPGESYSTLEWKLFDDGTSSSGYWRD